MPCGARGGAWLRGLPNEPLNLCHVVREWTDRVRVSADQVRVAGVGRPLRDAPIGHHNMQNVTGRANAVRDVNTLRPRECDTRIRYGPRIR